MSAHHLHIPVYTDTVRYSEKVKNVKTNEKLLNTKRLYSSVENWLIFNCTNHKNKRKSVTP